MIPLNLLVTLWPSFPHFPEFANDKRLFGIRLNSAMITNEELKEEFARLTGHLGKVPLYFDIKGRQPRVKEFIPNDDHLILRLNHPISVHTPTPVLFKAGVDHCLLDHLEDDGRTLVFQGGPHYQVKPGESLHIRHPSFRMHGPVFTDIEKAKIEKVNAFGINRWFLSYVEEQRDVDEFMELVGQDDEVWLKIETKRGLQYVAKTFRKRDNLRLVAARGDLFVEIDKPHQIMEAMRLIISRDREACVGSRMLLSVIHEPVPSCADLLELAWLTDIGYRTFMLCDELCLKGPLLATAVNVFQSFREAYDVPEASRPIQLPAPRPREKSTYFSRLFSVFSS